MNARAAELAGARAGRRGRWMDERAAAVALAADCFAGDRDGDGDGRSVEGVALPGQHQVEIQARAGSSA